VVITLPPSDPDDHRGTGGLGSLPSGTESV
jgi:hypothetical protein